MGIQAGAHVRVPLHSHVIIECMSFRFMTWVYQPDLLIYFNDTISKPRDLPRSSYQNGAKLIIPEFNQNMSGYYICQMYHQMDIKLTLTPGKKIN